MTVDQARNWIDDAHQDWADETRASWALTAGDELVGEVALRLDLVEGRAVIAFWAVPHRDIRVIMVPAVVLATQWGFDLGLHRIEIHRIHQSRSWLNMLARHAGYAFDGHAFRLEARHTAACEAYEIDHPEPYGDGQARERWFAGLPERPEIVDRLRELGTDHLAIRMLLTLGTERVIPGWLLLGLRELSEREDGFVDDWLATVQHLTQSGS